MKAMRKEIVVAAVVAVPIGLAALVFAQNADPGRIRFHLVGSIAGVGEVRVEARVQEGVVAKASSTLQVKKLYDGARSYYEEELSSRSSSTPIPKQFPANSEATVGRLLAANLAMAAGNSPYTVAKWLDLDPDDL